MSKMSCFQYFILVCVFFIKFSHCDLTVTANPKVEIPDVGAVFGETYHYVRTEYPVIDTHVDIFRGIPFAEPPIGELRFAKPIPAAPFTEDYNATYFRKACPQLGLDSTDWSEDCLHVNIWTPSPRVSNAAVMVFIHGGAFLLGDGVGSWDDGVPVVGFHDVVHVTIHYRLNVFGYLSTGDSVLPGNYGMWDQLLAMKWIKNNIAAFGGNPDNILLFGQSAGAASVGLHLVSPHSFDTYNRAGLMSGTGSCPWAIRDIEAAKQDAINVGKACDCDTSSSQVLLECLRELPMDNVTAAANKVVLSITNTLPFVPVVDSDFLPDHPVNLINQGEFKQCDILLGSTKDEGTIFASRAFPEENLRRNPYVPKSRWDTAVEDYVYSYHNDVILEAVNQQYVDWSAVGDPDANYFWFFVEMNSDEAFACPVDYYAREWAKAANDVYLYQFNHYTSNLEGGLPMWTHVAHGDDVQFVFGVALNPISELDQTPEEINMTRYMMGSWANFAKYGNPNSNDFDLDNMDTAWPLFNIEELRYKEHSANMPNKQGLKAHGCHFWNDFVPKMVTFSADLHETERQWREDFYGWKYEDMVNWQTAFDEYQNFDTNRRK